MPAPTRAECKELVVVSLTHQFCYTVALKARFPDVQQVAL